MTNTKLMDALKGTKLVPSTRTGENVVKEAQPRPNSDFMDSIIGVQFDALDHGFVRLIDYMGNDSSVVQAARVSYGAGTKKISEDRGLIRYLMRHWHSTPFEMAEIKIHVKLPIFIARQWIRHRTASVNEYSARYSILDKEFYIPEAEHLAVQSADNKQGRGEVLEKEQADKVRELLIADAMKCYGDYEDMIDEEGDIHLARELARMNLTINSYTQWYWKVNLHNFMHFLRLRMDRHAQYEIRVYAELLAEILKGWCPYTYEAFIDYRVNAVSFSAQQWEFIQARLQEHYDAQPETFKNIPEGLTKRELNEMMAVLDLK